MSTTPTGYITADDIEFTVVEGGTILIGGVEQSEIIMYDNEYTSLAVSKSWDDTGHEDVRPNMITVSLLQDDSPIDSHQLTADDWSYTFENLVKYSALNTPYDYTIVEENMTNYSASYGRQEASNGLEIKFSADSSTEAVSYDYVDIFYYDSDNVLRKLGRWGGKSALKNLTVQVPALDFYLYWRSDSSTVDYGFSIDSITPITVEPTSLASTGTLPSYTIQEISGNTYPETAHNYTNNENILWHYTGASSGDLITITNTWDPPFVTLTITNKVEGNLGDKSKEFHYTIYADVDSMEMLKSSMGLLFAPTNGGTEVAFTNGQYEFTLKHNERIDFQVLQGTDVRVVQESTEYTTTVNDDSTLVFEDTINDVTTVNYINRLGGAVPTGIDMPIYFGIALILGSILYFVGKRKERIP